MERIPVASAPARYEAGVTRLTRRAFVGAAGAAAAGFALGSSGPARAAEASAADEIVIFHTNDTHGYLQGDGESVVGIDLVAGLRAATPNSLLLDAGDATQGAPLASLTKGEAPIDLMSAAGYDAMCLGNHEFDFGLDNLLANAEAATFPLLAANALRDGAPLLAGVAGPDVPGAPGRNAVLTCGGRRIGVFGLTTQATAWSVSPSALGDVVFADEVTTAEGQIAELAMQGVDAIVCLAHLGNGPVPCTGLGLAQSLSPDAAFRLTAIIDGHSHTVEDVLVNGVLVVQTGCNLSALGKLTLTFASDGTVSAAEELLDPAAVASQAAPAPDVAADLEAIAATQDEMLSEKLTINPTTLWAGWLDGNDLAAPTRMVETNYGDFVCECFINRASALLAQTGLDDGTPLLAVTNGGGIRAALPRGIVTVRDLVTAFPFSNTVQVKRITPKILRSLFEASFSSMAGQDGQSGMLLQEEISGSFLQLAGFEVTCDPNAPVGQRVKDIYVYGLAGSVDLDDDETPLYLASNSYVMAGGDAYEALADAEMVAEVGGELEAIRSYLDELSDVLGRGIGLRCLPLLAGTKGRLILDGGHEPAPWVATLRLVDAAGEPLPDTDVLLDIDASTCVTTTSDADGYVQVELEDGPHGIAACDPRGFVSFTYEGVDGDGVLGVSYVRQTEASTDLDGLFTSDNVTLPQDVSGARSSSIFDVASAYPNGVTDTLTGQVYAAATTSNDLGIAAMRALMEPATEAYVDNRMGIGLVEDDLRAFPTVTMAPAPEDAEAVWAHIEQMRATLSSELDARGATLDEPLSSAAADAIRATYGA